MRSEEQKAIDRARRQRWLDARSEERVEYERTLERERVERLDDLGGDRCPECGTAVHRVPRIYVGGRPLLRCENGHELVDESGQPSHKALARLKEGRR